MSGPARASKKPTWRKVVVYACGLLVLAAADPRPASFAAGAAVVAAGWILRVWAFGHLDKNRLLVTTGPYAHTRNPAYLGSFLMLTGLCLAAGNADSARGMAIWGGAVALCAAFFAFYLPRKMRREYPRLQELFGEEVERHAAHVPDFWPRLRPWRSGQQRSFSWGMVRENHEFSWGIVFLLALAAVWTVESWSPFAPSP